MDELISSTQEQLDHLVRTWRTHPITQLLLDVCKQESDHVINDSLPLLSERETKTDYASGYLSGKLYVLHKILNHNQWITDEIEMKQFEEKEKLHEER